MAEVSEQVLSRFGRLDILINNAGINTRRDRVPIHEYKLEDWNKILEVDLTGVFVTSQALIPAMLKNKRGRIVNISSIAGLVPLRLQSAFVAAKGRSGESNPFDGPRTGAQRNPCQCGRAWFDADCRYGSTILWT
jgi:NAD(P)-dependent dehydrogenase (short-subunit alcohol dehydrogenase family)